MHGLGVFGAEFLVIGNSADNIIAEPVHGDNLIRTEGVLSIVAQGAVLIEHAHAEGLKRTVADARPKDPAETGDPVCYMLYKAAQRGRTEKETDPGEEPRVTD